MQLKEIKESLAYDRHFPIGYDQDDASEIEGKKFMRDLRDIRRAFILAGMYRGKESLILITFLIQSSIERGGCW